MTRPSWLDSVGDFPATLSKQTRRRLGVSVRRVRAFGVSPVGVALRVYEERTGTYLGEYVSVVLVGEARRKHLRASRRCRLVQRRLRRVRAQRKSRRGW